MRKFLSDQLPLAAAKFVEAPSRRYRLLLLPPTRLGLDSSMRMPPLSAFDLFDTRHTQLAAHVPCLSVVKFDSASLDGARAQYAHMVESVDSHDTWRFERSALDARLLYLVLLTSHLMTTADNPLIIPSGDALLNAQMRAFFADVVVCFSLMFANKSSSSSSSNEDIGDIDDDQLAESFRAAMLTKPPQESDTSFERVRCRFCSALSGDVGDGDDTQRLLSENKYSLACVAMNLKREQTTSCVKLTAELFDRYAHLKSMVILDTPLELGSDEDGNDDDAWRKLNDLWIVELRNNAPLSIGARTSLFSLASLRHLRIGDNELALSAADRHVFAQLVNLEQLELDNVSAFKRSSSSTSSRFSFQLPAKLSELSVVAAQLDYFPFTAAAADVAATNDRLKSVSFTGVPLLNVDAYEKSKTLISLRLVGQVYDKIVGDEQAIRRMFAHFQASAGGGGGGGDGFLSKADAFRLNAFVFKRFARIGDNAEAEEASLGGIPPSVFAFTALTSLNLSFQAIRRIPDEIASLTQLSRLVLVGCVLLEAISARLSQLPITQLDLTNCYSLKTPPPEIVKRGTKSILGFLKKLSLGSVLCQKTKLMLVSIGHY